MRIALALSLVTGGCQFNVQPVAVHDASVGDLYRSNAVDDLAKPPDAALLPDFSSPDLASNLPPDLAHSCGDTIKNGDESDVDCGGSCPHCSDGRLCGGNGDCLSTHCLNNRCVACITGSQCGAPLEFCVQNQCNSLTTGLIAYWNLDERSFTSDCATPTVADSSGNNHAGLACPASAMNSGPTAGMPGKFGTCASFAATPEQHIDVPASPAFNTAAGDFTISLFVWLNSAATDMPVYESLSSSTSHQYLVHHATTGWAFEERPAAGANTVVISQGGVTTTTGAWHHLALVRSANTWTLYLDGSSIATVNNAVAVLDSSGIVLGWSLDNSNQLDGRLDEYRIYGRALSPAEIKGFTQ